MLNNKLQKQAEESGKSLRPGAQFDPATGKPLGPHFNSRSAKPRAAKADTRSSTKSRARPKFDARTGKVLAPQFDAHTGKPLLSQFDSHLHTGQRIVSVQQVDAPTLEGGGAYESTSMLRKAGFFGRKRRSQPQEDRKSDLKTDEDDIALAKSPKIGTGQL